MPAFERLSAVDASFLVVEDGKAHMHVGGVFLFKPGPLIAPTGAVDIAALRRAIRAKLHLVPRYRQKLVYVPFERHPVWVDDDRFDLDYHVRLTALPHPGGMAELKRLTGRLMGQALDRSRPLWEMWFVEGLDNGCFAMIAKTHHCMIDGIAGTDLMGLLMDWDPQAPIGDPMPWRPRSAPHAVDLVADAVWHRMPRRQGVVQATAEALLHPARALWKAGAYVESIGEALTPGLHGGSLTPFNVPIGPHRRFDWVDMPLDEIKAIKQALGGTVNDVVLAIVSGALRRFLLHRNADVEHVHIRAMVPVNIRTEAERGQAGNRITLVSAPLPVGAQGARERLREATKIMQAVKHSHQAVGAERLATIAEYTAPGLLVQAVRTNARLRGFNLTVTNVPGPQLPLYLHGCELVQTFPLVPLWANQALGIALLSYNGTLHWGLNGCYDALHDLSQVAEFIRDAFAELQREAGTAPAAARTPGPRKRQAAAEPTPRVVTPEAFMDEGIPLDCLRNASQATVVGASNGNGQIHSDSQGTARLKRNRVVVADGRPEIAASSNGTAQRPDAAGEHNGDAGRRNGRFRKAGTGTRE